MAERSNVLRFLRPTIFVVVCYALAMTGSYFLSKKGEDSIGDRSDIDKVASTMASLIVPEPSLSPRQVVQVQLDALANKDRSAGVVQCMTFASPGNRVVTGPLDRFAKMVRGKEFRILSEPDRVLVGKTRHFNENARVLVSCLAGKELRSFVWVLSKQQLAPHEGCWMTEGVFPHDASLNRGEEI